MKTLTTDLGTKITHIRHGRSVMNARYSDPNALHEFFQDPNITDHERQCPLHDIGIQQATALSQHRHLHFPEEVLLYCSPLPRAIQTCKIIFPEIPPIIDPRLEEHYWGLSLIDLHTQVREKAEAEYARCMHYKMPSGQSLYDQYMLAWDFYHQNLKYWIWARERPVLVSHDGTIKCNLMVAAGILPEHWSGFKKVFHLSNCARLEIYPESSMFRCIQIEEVAHPNPYSQITSFETLRNDALENCTELIAP